MNRCILSLAVWALSLSSSAQSGSRDATFGLNGWADIQFPGWDIAGATAMALQSDGKVVIGGGMLPAQSIFDHRWAFARLDVDGTLDPSFSGDGKMQIDWGGSDGSMRALVIQPDGKIIGCGSERVGTYRAALARVNTNGTSDVSFSGDGRMFAPLCTGDQSSAEDLFLQPDGKIVAVGWSACPSELGMVVMRFLPDGQADTTFQGDGVMSIPNAVAYACARQVDGKFVVGGSIGDTMAVFRFMENGDVDSSFANNGVFSIVVGSQVSVSRAVVIEPDGKILVGGGIGNVNPYTAHLLRLTATGALDSTFSSDGMVVGLPVPTTGGLRALVRQADGSILGLTIDAATDSLLLSKFVSNGDLDSTFSEDGLVKDSGPGFTFSEAMVAQADGKILICGQHLVGSGQLDMYAIRYMNDIALHVGQDDLNEALVFPNPANSHIRVPQRGNGEMLIREASGREVRRAGSDRDAAVYVGDLGPGLYLVQFTDVQGHARSARFVKE